MSRLTELTEKYYHRHYEFSNSVQMAFKTLLIDFKHIVEQYYNVSVFSQNDIDFLKYMSDKIYRNLNKFNIENELNIYDKDLF